MTTTGYNSNQVQATLTGQILWDGKPVIDDDDGGTAGVHDVQRAVL